VLPLTYMYTSTYVVACTRGFESLWCIYLYG